MKKDDLLERYGEIAAALGRAEPELEALDLATRVRQNAAVNPAARRPRRMVWSGALAVAACLALYLGLRPSEFRAKGGGAATWTGVRIYRVAGDGAPTPLEKSLRRADGVLVSYTNLGDDDHLMVFAVGAGGRVSWLYPAWERAGDDPESIAIARGEGVELRTLVHPNWEVGPVTLHALFSRRALHVKEVERQLSEGVALGDQTFAFTVEP